MKEKNYKINRREERKGKEERRWRKKGNMTKKLKIFCMHVLNLVF